MPKTIEINVSVSQGGKVQIVEYGKITSDFHLSTSERWNVEDLNERAVGEFRIARIEHLQKVLEPIVQHEFDTRFEQVQS
jgi:hypothetical protein